MNQRLAAFKAAFDRSRVHLNNAGLAPISAPAADALRVWTQRFYSEGYGCDAAYAAGVEAVRADLATVLGVDQQRLALTPSTAYGVSQVAFGIPLQPGDEVLSIDQEYGSNLYPWAEACRQRGAQLRLAVSGPGLSISAADLEQLLTPATRVVAVSWVQYQTGAVLDLARLGAVCQARGLLLCVDGMQGVGLMPMTMDAWGLDALCGGSHKWLASPVGAGYMALSPRLAGLLQPRTLGAQSYGSCDDAASLRCVPKRDASRFEPGAKASLELLALGASLTLLQDCGIALILAEAQRLARLLRVQLRAAGYRIVCPHAASDDALDDAQQRGGIVAARPTSRARWQTLADMQAALAAGGIYVVQRGDALRMSLHAFNTDDDIATALRCL